MALLHHFLLLLLLFISFSTPPSISAAASAAPQALLSPITKDPQTSLYTISFPQNPNPLLLDLTSPFSWSSCPLHHPIFTCSSPPCSLVASSPSPSCPNLPKPSTKLLPHPLPCKCLLSPANPLTGLCALGDLTSSKLAISATDGRNPTSVVTVENFLSACAPREVLDSLPSGGVAGLGCSPLSLVQQLAADLKIKQQFAVCLPSTSTASGVVFFGSGPFYLLPPTSLDVTTVLSYTPLLRHPMNPKNYYINLAGVAVGGVAVRFLRRILEFDSLGHGGVMLSTAARYTVLRSHVYQPFIRAFAESTKAIRRAPKVEPFELCFNTSKLGFTRVGYAVPQIDLMFAGGKNWTLFGANSVKQVAKDTACLAFVDGGPKAEQAVVIGGFQMEDNFLLFDLEKKRLGFSSSLFFIRTTCGNFNFTSGV